MYESVDDPEKFGLLDPTANVTVYLNNDDTLRVILGDETPDGAAHYAQMEGFPQLFLIDSSWGRVLIKIVDSPPIPKWYLKVKDPSDFTGVDIITDDQKIEIRKKENEWKDAKSGNSFVVENPFTEQFISQVPASCDADVNNPELSQTIQECKHFQKAYNRQQFDPMFADHKLD